YTFPTPAAITAHTPEAFRAAAWPLVGRKVNKARMLADLYRTAQESIGLPVAIDTPAIAMGWARAWPRDGVGPAACPMRPHARAHEVPAARLSLRHRSRRHLSSPGDSLCRLF